MSSKVRSLRPRVPQAPGMAAVTAAMARQRTGRGREAGPFVSSAGRMCPRNSPSSPAEPCRIFSRVPLEPTHFASSIAAVAPPTSAIAFSSPAWNCSVTFLICCPKSPGRRRPISASTAGDEIAVDQHAVAVEMTRSIDAQFEDLSSSRGTQYSSRR
jgi:hypothetical protein